MEALGELGRRPVYLFRRGHFNGEMEEEMRFHLESREAEYRERGVAAAEAGPASRRRFGNAMLVRAHSREAWGWSWLDAVAQDVRLALRGLSRNPLFSSIVALTLACGIGVNAAIFSAVQALILNPYPFPDARRLAAVEAFQVSGNNGGTGYQDFLDWQAQNSVFDAIAIEPWTGSYSLTGEGEPRRIMGGSTTAGFWKVLGIQPAMGRLFAEQDDLPGAAPVAVITWEAWQQHFGKDPEILRRTLTVEGGSFAIIGVLPRGFAYPGIPTSEIFTPLHGQNSLGRNQHQYGVVARLKPGISIAQAQSEMSTIASRLERLYPETNTGWRIRVRPLRQALAEEVRSPVLLMSASVAFVLLLACVNVAGLLLARASGKTREVGIRAALGAGRGRIVRQMLTETAVLSVAGGTAGIVLALWIMATLALLGAAAGIPAALACSGILRSVLYGVSPRDGMVFLGVPLVLVLVALAASFAPALRAEKMDAIRALRCE